MDTLSFDIESASASELFSFGPGFVRLVGWQWLDASGQPTGPITTGTDPSQLVDLIERATAVTAHNGINFDLLALSRYHGLDYEASVIKAFDTLLAEKHLVPVAAKGAQPNGFYQLGQTAERYGLDGKDSTDFEGKREIYRRAKGDAYANRMKPGKETSFGVLKLLAAAYGGFHLIPLDDPDYVRYLRKDVAAQSGLFRAQLERVRDLPREGDGSQTYLRREHRVSTSMGRSTLEGFRTDVDLTMRRWSEGQARLEASKQMMHRVHGMPLEGKKPHVTNPGKAAFRRAILATGISEDALDANWPVNQDGSLSMAKPVLTDMLTVFEGRNEPAAELCRTIMAMNGERTVYGTVLANLVGDRVHPYIGADQASGRWSMKDPGLTVLGKRGGKARERAMMLADDGEWLAAIDADQIDARMVAALSQDADYMALFGPGIDLHSEVAYRVWPNMALHDGTCHDEEREACDCGVVRKCHCVLRDRAKVFGHGWNYGMGPGSMARNHGVDIGIAQQFDRGMQSGFPVLCRWKDDVRAAAGAMSYGEAPPPDDTYRILYTAFGRPVRVERDRAYTQATALVGQGSTRDGMAEAILRLPSDVRRKIRAVVHDEIVVSIAGETREAAQAKAQAIADSMAFDVAGVRISFGCSRVARSWAGCYGEQYEA